MGKPAASALCAGCVFQRLTNIKSTQKCWLWDKRSSSVWTNSVVNATLNTGLWAWNAIELEQTEKILPLPLNDLNQRWFSFQTLMCYYSNSIIQMSTSGAIVMNTNFLSLTRSPHTDKFMFYSTATVFVAPANILLSVQSAVKFNPLSVNNHSLTSQSRQHHTHKHRCPTAQRTLTNKHRPTIDRRGSQHSCHPSAFT